LLVIVVPFAKLRGQVSDSGIARSQVDQHSVLPSPAASNREWLALAQAHCGAPPNTLFIRASLCDHVMLVGKKMRSIDGRPVAVLRA
jgi:hypothetical protein